MNESEYHKLCDGVFAEVEILLDDAGMDFDAGGGVLDIRPDEGGPVIVNRQPAPREIWIAAKSGGFHFRLGEDGKWRDTRDQSEFFAKLRGLLALPD